MTRLVETIAFLRVDARLAAALLARAEARGDLAATHQDLAEDIGAAREVVSRQLAEFQRAGYLRLARGRIVAYRAPRLGRSGLRDVSHRLSAARVYDFPSARRRVFRRYSMTANIGHAG